MQEHGYQYKVLIAMQTFCGITTDGMSDYLAAIYRISQSDSGTSNKVTTSLLAEKMHVSTAAASSMLKRLEESGFVLRSGQDGVRLEKQGHLAAMQLIRRHRMLEVFLMQVMNFTWDQVDVEAHRLEHAISIEFVDRMDQICGYPTHCPHGDPIPTKDGHMPAETLHPVTDLQPGDSGYLWRVATDDARILRYLAQRQLTPGQHITLVDIEPFKGPVTIEIEPAPFRKSSLEDSGEKTQILGAELAALLYLSIDKSPNEMRSGWSA